MIAIDIGDRVPEAIQAEFADRDVQKVVPSTGTPDGVPMAYYRDVPDVFPSLSGAENCGSSTKEMLIHRNGVCDAWAGFFRDCLAVHGLTANSRSVVAKQIHLSEANLLAALASSFGGTWTVLGPPLSPSRSFYLFVKNWDATNPFTPTPQNGAPAQANLNPRSYFDGHQVVEYQGSIYDPSYGTGPFLTLSAWEDASITGIGCRFSAESATGVQKSGYWLGRLNHPASEETILGSAPGGQ